MLVCLHAILIPNWTLSYSPAELVVTGTHPHACAFRTEIGSSSWKSLGYARIAPR